MEEKDFKLLNTFHEQFSESQNYIKGLFIQFLTAVSVVLFGYVIVFTRVNEDSLFFDVTLNKDNEIITYGIFHFILTYFITQIILILLSSLILNTGYEFRRDQKVAYSIRKKYISEKDYNETFGKNKFTPIDKTCLTFLPGFHFIFCTVLYILQFFISLSFYMQMISLDNWNKGVFWIILMSMIPITYSIVYYFIYFKKYKKYLNRELETDKIILNEENTK